MLKYLVVQLSDDAVSFCNWRKQAKGHKLMPLDVLKEAIFYAMKENLIVQFSYPEYELPKEYLDEIQKVDHINIKPLNNSSDGDMAVCDISELPYINGFRGIITVHATIKELLNAKDSIIRAIREQERVNIIIDNIPDFNDSDVAIYSDFLHSIAGIIIDEIKIGRYPQLNLLTDRIALGNMNNCNAGVESLAICPDGNFYICPGFYMDNLGSVGNISERLLIRNHNLYTIEYAPICMHCDAFHCKRCVKLNKQLTLEVNTPSHQQCVISHVERNVSRELLCDIKEQLNLFNNIEIPVNNCLDPFDERYQWEE